MDTFKLPELNPTHRELPQDQFVTEYLTCAMCDTELDIRHEINSIELKVKEEAYCPSCGIRVRITHHQVH